MILGLMVLFMNGEIVEVGAAQFPSLEVCREATDDMRSQALLAGVEVRTACIDPGQMDRGAGREIGAK